MNMRTEFKNLLEKETNNSIAFNSPKSLSFGKRGTGGRNNLGRITIRRRGGGHKRRIYNIDYNGYIGKESTWIIKDIKYNPNSSSKYILLCSSPEGRLKFLPFIEGSIIGNSAPLFEKIGDIRVGTQVCNVEISPGKGCKFIRAAGVSGNIIKKEGDLVQIKLPSGKIIDIDKNCKVLRGRIGNEDHRNKLIGKAGRNRWLGKRPRVRGEAMNPVDHPHGGKTSRSGGLGKPFKNIWGQLAKWS